MNPPRVYMSSQSWTPLPPPIPYHLSGSSPCTSPKHAVSCIKHRLAIHFLHDSIHVSVPFSQIILPSPSPTESKRLFSTAVSLSLSHIQGYRYHLSKFHIYALVYGIGVFLSGLLHLFVVRMLKTYSLTLLVGMQTSTATMENCMEIPWKTGSRTAIWPSNPTAGHTHWGNQNWERHVYPNVHRSTVYNSQDMEAT